jgi:hypothetical protein
LLMRDSTSAGLGDRHPLYYSSSVRY